MAVVKALSDYTAFELLEEFNENLISVCSWVNAYSSFLKNEVDFTVFGEINSCFLNDALSAIRQYSDALKYMFPYVQNFLN